MDAITIKKFPNLERFGANAGQPNVDFLNPDLFGTAFLASCEHVREKLGLPPFDFSRFRTKDYEHGRHLVSDLNASF